MKKSAHLTRLAKGAGEKAQAATEFLITYGWALGSLAVILLVLYSTGIFTPTTYVSQQCVITSSFDCLTYYMTLSGHLVLNVRQTLDSPINITAFECVQTRNPSLFTKPSTPSGQAFVPVGGNFMFNVQCYSSIGPVSSPTPQQYSGSVYINYTNDVTQLPGTAYGSIVVRTGGGSTSTTSSSTSTTSSTTTIAYTFGGIYPPFSPLTLNPGYTYYFCAFETDTASCSMSWTPDETSSWTSIGHQSSNVCDTVNCHGSLQSLAGIGFTAPSYTVRTQGSSDTASMSFSYSVAGTQQYSFILIADIYGFTVGPTLPAGCTKLGSWSYSQTQIYTYAAVCSAQAAGTYTVTGTAAAPTAGGIGWTVYSN